MIDPTCTDDTVAALRPLHAWHVGLECDAIEADTRLWSMPGIFRRWGTLYASVYLPAVAPYLVRGLDGTDHIPTVRLPEGVRGRLASHDEELWCVRSPLAALPCEGSPLPEGHPVNPYLQRGPEVHGEGHVWVGEVRHTCARCGCARGVTPLAARAAPTSWQARGLGDVDCARGDERTRNTLRDSLTAYLCGGFGEQTYRTTPAMRRGILERATAPISAGGRWLLPDDVAPEDADELERPRWVDLAALVRESPTAQRSLLAFDRWLAGAGPAPREGWFVAGMWSEAKPQIAALLAVDGPPVYLDARVLVAAVRASWRDEERHGNAHPAEIVCLDLRELHEEWLRAARPSLLLLLPAADPALDGPVGLRSARALWSSGR